MFDDAEFRERARRATDSLVFTASMVTLAIVLLVVLVGMAMDGPLGIDLAVL
jgi:hypothetical protein